VLDEERIYEYVNGQPVEKAPFSARRSGICGRLLSQLGNFAEGKSLGEFYVRTSFQIGDNERIPDLAFISTERFPPEGEPETIWLIAPDLTVEVVSPSDYYEKVHAKAMEYLTAGVKVVWIVSPENQTITVYRSATNIMAFPPESELTCEDLFPGFRCPLSEIFKAPKKA
jgi:Uma2 family endonuclease